MILTLVIIYVMLGLTFIVALAFAAAAPAPKKNCHDELLQLMLRTELRSKPPPLHMDEAA